MFEFETYEEHRRERERRNRELELMTMTFEILEGARTFHRTHYGSPGDHMPFDQAPY